MRSTVREWFAGAIESRFLDALSGWKDGELMLTLPDGRQLFYGDADGPRVELHVHDRNFFQRATLGADIGIGESYMAGEWSSPDLPQLILAFLRNRDYMAVDQRLVQIPVRVFNWVKHLRRRNTEKGSEENIHAHYDLGNAFYELFLDPTMAYSSAIFPDETASLEEAQAHKYKVICERLDLGPDDHLLEIGSGWGGLAIHAAQTTGCRVTTITISREQFALAKERIEEAGLSDRIDIRYCDYRHIDGTYTKVVSIEMLEAVGEQYWDTFFKKIDEVLTDAGKALIQVICVPDLRFASYGPASDWIRKHVFPGGRLPSFYELQRSVRRSSMLETIGLDEIGLHYAPTLRMWRERFWKAADSAKQLGFDERFMRFWDFYLASCEASFASEWNRNIHLVLGRPKSKLFCAPTGS